MRTYEETHFDFMEDANMKKGTETISIDSEIFAGLKAGIDKTVNKTIGTMQRFGADEAMITFKMPVKLAKETVNVPGGYRDVIIPKFKYDISSVMQVKDKTSGEISGNYQLEWDEGSQQFVTTIIDDGQEDLFDADYEVKGEPIGIGPGAPELPEAAVEAEKADSEDYPKEDDASDDEAASDFDEAMEAFKYMTRYIGDSLHITESNGNYAVRNQRNAIVLVSGGPQNSPFSVDAETLAKHKGGELFCYGYMDNDGEPVLIRIEDTADGVGEETVIFSMERPGATEEQISDALKDDGYEYEEPQGA